MKELRMKSLKSNIIVILILGIIGAWMLLSNVDSFAVYLSKPTDMDDLDYSQDLNGTYVNGTVYGIYDWYCETTEGTKTISREYLIDGGTDYYMGMLVMARDINKAEALMNASYDYLDGVDDGTALAAAQYNVKGTIVKMPYDSLKLYKEYLEWDTMSAEDQGVFLPYYLEVGKIKGTAITGMWILMGLGTLLIVIALWILISCLNGSRQKAIKKYIAQSSSPNMASEKVEGFLSSTPWSRGLKLNRQFICGQNGGTTIFEETSKLLWAYQLTTTHKRNFITVGKTYQLMLCFLDGSRRPINMKNEQDVLENLKMLSETCPHTIVGYTDELDKLFRKDMPGFRALKYDAAMADLQGNYA